jgi:hypothetical protein
MSDTKYVNPGPKTRLVHVETDLAIVNIYLHLTDTNGQRVESVEVIPNNYAGEPQVITDNDIRHIRIVEPVVKEQS